MAWQDRDYSRQEPLSLSRRVALSTSVTTWLIVINVAIFLIDMVLGPWMKRPIGPLSYWGEFRIDLAVSHWQLWRFVTYQFLHAGPVHILFNMFGLYFFGRVVEQWWGGKRFLAFYLLCGMAGAYFFWVLAYLVPSVLSGGVGTGLVGASGSIYGILIGCAVVAPHMRVMLLIPPIPMSMRTLALVFLGIAGITIVIQGKGAASEACHLGGAALGFLLVKEPRLLEIIGPSHPRTRPRRRRHSRLLENWQRKRLLRQRQRDQEEEAEVDRILAKVKDHGLHSLSEREKRTLHRATERQRREEAL